MASGSSRRVLFISPHFPPDATAGAHRARVLAPYLAAHGWEPIVLTVDPACYEGSLDHELAAAFPSSVEVVRCAAFPAKWTRRMGVGDLGLRALPQLAAAARSLVATRGIGLVYVTTYPIYHAVIGPRIKRRTGARFVLDLQDPWVGAWGDTVGPARDGGPDAKSQASRALAARLERLVLPQADALTSVSSGLLDEMAARYPALAAKPRIELPIGISPHDLEWIAAHPGADEAYAARTLCYAGTVLPLGMEVIGALFDAIERVRRADPRGEWRARFVGTSNQATPAAPARLRDLIQQKGLDDLVVEHAPRVPFFDALRALRRADAVLLLGTSEARYTASKLAAALAIDRPLLAVFHQHSDVTRALAPVAAADPAVALVTYSEPFSAYAVSTQIASVLQQWKRSPPPRPAAALSALQPFLAPALASRLARLFDQVTEPVHA